MNFNGTTMVLTTFFLSRKHLEWSDGCVMIEALDLQSRGHGFLISDVGLELEGTLINCSLL